MRVCNVLRYQHTCAFRGYEKRHWLLILAMNHERHQQQWQDEV
jgi:hypothetical protein